MRVTFTHGCRFCHELIERLAIRVRAPGLEFELTIQNAELFTRNLNSSSRGHHDFDATILFVIERGKSARRLSKLQSMGDDETWVDFAVLDPLEQGAEVPLGVRSTCFDG